MKLTHATALPWAPGFGEFFAELRDSLDQCAVATQVLPTIVGNVRTTQVLLEISGLLMYAILTAGVRFSRASSLRHGEQSQNSHEEQALKRSPHVVHGFIPRPAEVPHGCPSFVNPL